MMQNTQLKKEELELLITEVGIIRLKMENNYDQTTE